MANNKIIVVDFEEVIYESSQLKGLHDVFCRFTLTDMIEQILSVSPYIDYSIHIAEVVGPWLEDGEHEAFDYDLFIIFFESLISDIDKAITDQYGHLIDSRNTIWLFNKWITHTAALIRLE